MHKKPKASRRIVAHRVKLGNRPISGGRRSAHAPQ